MKKNARNIMETITKKPSASIIQQLQFGNARKFHYDANLERRMGALVQSSSKSKENEPVMEKVENEMEGENHLLEFDSPTGAKIVCEFPPISRAGKTSEKKMLAIKATKMAIRQNTTSCPEKEKTTICNLSNDGIKLEESLAFVESGEMEVSNEKESREKIAEKMT
jgi:hypothetical protein